ncbi:MAG TPA: hypothetical protein VK049_00320 [Paenalcaligenes sp.]|nr:hypothetical protein [Paenalcaligenes sp.]
MKIAKGLGRSLAAFSVLTLMACQTTPHDATPAEDAPAETTEQEQSATTAPVEPGARTGQGTEATDQEVEYSPMMVFLADFEPVDGWAEVTLDEETTLYLQPEPSFTRDDLMSVETYSSDSGEGLLALMLTDTARQRLENITTENPDRRLALAVDGTLLAVPRYSEPLTNGQLVFMVGSVENAQTAAEIIAGDDGRATPYSEEQQPQSQPQPQVQP